MSDMAQTVDQLAARNLLLAMGLDLDDGSVALAAEHMRAHRVAAQRFDAAKAREDLLARLESAFVDRTHPDDAAWSAGYAAAEREALTWATERASRNQTVAPRSIGAHLRSMIRTAKQQSSAKGAQPRG